MQSNFIGQVSWISKFHPEEKFIHICKQTNSKHVTVGCFVIKPTEIAKSQEHAGADWYHTIHEIHLTKYMGIYRFFREAVENVTYEHILWMNFARVDCHPLYSQRSWMEQRRKEKIPLNCIHRVYSMDEFSQVNHNKK